MDIGPILPKYIPIIIINWPAVFKSAVMPRERPTVAMALATSNRESSIVNSLVIIRSMDNTTNAIKLISTTANDFLIKS